MKSSRISLACNVIGGWDYWFLGRFRAGTELWSGRLGFWSTLNLQGEVEVNVIINAPSFTSYPTHRFNLFKIICILQSFLYNKSTNTSTAGNPAITSSNKGIQSKGGGLELQNYSQGQNHILPLYLLMMELKWRTTLEYWSDANSRRLLSEESQETSSCLLLKKLLENYLVHRGRIRISVTGLENVAQWLKALAALLMPSSVDTAHTLYTVTCVSKINICINNLKKRNTGSGGCMIKNSQAYFIWMVVLLMYYFSWSDQKTIYSIAFLLIMTCFIF